MFEFLKKKVVKKVEPVSVWGDGTAVLSAIDDGVVAIDPKGNLRIINPAAEQMIGWTNGDATGLVFDSVLTLVDGDGNALERAANPIQRALFEFESFTSNELFLKTQSGKIRQIFLRINPVDDMKTGLVVVFRDISKEVKENREQAEFISTASHEMRTPVASIEGYLGLALNPNTATIDNRARDYLQKAHESTRYLGELFRDLLDISKAEDGRMKNEPVVLDAVDFTRDIWEGLKTKAEAKNLEYIFMPDQKTSSERTLTPVYFVHADRDHLREVLDNLFENAIKYTPSGKVVVNVSGDNQNVRISVEDSGIGIPAEDIPHLFQKFYRVDNSETREIGGTGLGLYLSRKLVEGLGGKLSLESEYKKGSIFTVQLPRLERNKAEKLIEQEQPVIEKSVKSGDENPQTYTEETATDVSSLQSMETTSVNNPLSQMATIQSAIPTQNQPPAQYYSQEEAIRNYQAQQYYAHQKARNDAQAQPQSQVQQNQAQQNPYFPSNQQPQADTNNYSLDQAYAPPIQQVQRPLYNQTNPTQNQPPTLSDIEKMREEYIRKIVAERQRQN